MSVVSSRIAHKLSDLTLHVLEYILGDASDQRMKDIAAYLIDLGGVCGLRVEIRNIPGAATSSRQTRNRTTDEAMVPRIEAVAQQLGGGDIAYSIAEAAAAHWGYDGADPNDFCLQPPGELTLGASLVFGGSNRLRWSPRRGFSIDAARCSPDFIDNFWRTDSSVLRGT